MTMDQAMATKNIEIAKKKKKKAYELNIHFQNNWAMKLLWVEFVLGSNGKVIQMRCKICT
jgi:hypothetical protein